jgi:TraX protein
MTAFKKNLLLVTAYDYLKLFAIAYMAIDHLGAYFYPDHMMFRALGRLSVPIWLFLIGYARSRRIDPPLIIGAIVLTLADYAVTHAFHALNILWSILIIRLTLTPLMRWVGTSENKLILVTALCFILTPVTRFHIDYGTIAYALAISGYLMRHGFEGEPRFPIGYIAISLGLYGITQALNFNFYAPHYAVLWIGGISLFYLLAVWFPRYAATSGTVPAPSLPALRTALSWIGHHTLTIYVGHLLVIYAVLFLSCRFNGQFPCFLTR